VRLAALAPDIPAALAHLADAAVHFGDALAAAQRAPGSAGLVRLRASTGAPDDPRKCAVNHTEGSSSVVLACKEGEALFMSLTSGP